MFIPTTTPIKPSVTVLFGCLRTPWRRHAGWRQRGALLGLFCLLAGCTAEHKGASNAADPQQVRADIMKLLPASTADAQGWATDISTAFLAQQLAASKENICAVVAVTAQESGFKTNPAVPYMAKIAWGEIERRAAERHIPAFVVHAGLHIPSSNGKSYSDRLDAARTEKDLSDIFDDFIAMVPLGQRLFGNLNPVHTAGPMQVSISFAEAHADHYPYPVDGTLRNEMFTRRGGMYFGIAHLLGYPTHYSQPLYRFADFNAGWYASRNAAFQNAVSRASGIPLALDGDVINYSSERAGATELAVRSLAGRLGLSDNTIRRALEQGNTLRFEKTGLYQQVFALADKQAGKALPREQLPGITLVSPKITRSLTTAWFAKRVDERYQQCLKHAARQ